AACPVQVSCPHPHSGRSDAPGGLFPGSVEQAGPLLGTARTSVLSCHGLTILRDTAGQSGSAVLFWPLRRGENVDACLLALRGCDRSRRTSQRIASRGRLRERDDISDRVAARQQHPQAVPPPPHTAP